MCKKRLLTCGLVSVTCMSMLFSGCSKSESETSAQNTTKEETQQEVVEEEPFEVDLTGATTIQLSDESITVNEEEISHDETEAVYAANDIVFYLEGQDFTYGEGTEADEHSQEEADAHTVVHITQPGTYVVSGELSAGQIAIDLGEDAEEDPEAVVNLVLNDADITCSVAPAVIFYNVYECGSTEDATKDVDTSEAGANVWILDDTENNIEGSYVARIYESVELNDEGTEVVDSKKLHKYDAAFYSKMSMNVDGGTGVLNISAENEGLDSELHLTVNGGNINITSGNDGINTNEDGISVTTINGGSVNIVVDGETGEGDGIDSNGWLVINGGTVTASACSDSQDAGIDSEMGIYLNGGNVTAGGNMLDQIAGTEQNYAVFTFADKVSGGTTITMKAEDDSVVGEWTMTNDFMYLLVSGEDLQEGTYTLWQGDVQLEGSSMMGGGMGGRGMGGQMPENGEMPEGMEKPEDGEMPEGMEKPEGGEIPEGMEEPEDGEMPQGMEKPEGGEMPEGMELPENGEMPEGMEKPEDGEMPEGMEKPEDEETPEGGQMAGGKGNRRGNMGQMSGEATAEFVISEGANFFSCQQVTE